MIRKALGIIMGSVLALAFMSLVPRVRADERDEATQLTFNQPVEIPGNHVLVAGTYWFVVANADSGGNTVRIFNADRTKKSIINVSYMGRFSTDRTVKEYAEEIWTLKPIKI